MKFSIILPIRANNHNPRDYRNSFSSLSSAQQISFALTDQQPKLPIYQMVLLQDDLASREQKRLESLRQRDQDRAKRFLDAKSRSIGIDKEYLDRQVEEKRMKEIEEKEEKAREGELIVLCVHWLVAMMWQ